jgi:hypothetical protein
MKDPMRLLASDATDFERLVLRAARCEQPSPINRRRMRRALILAEIGLLTAGFKAAASVSNHWFVVAVVAGVLAGKASSSADAFSPVNPVANVVTVTTQAPEPPVLPQVEPAPTADTASVPVEALEPAKDDAPVKLATRSIPPAKTSDLREEIRLLDQARSQIRSGSAAQALTTLRQYRSLFPRGAFLQEASVLRIEALAASGNRTLAASEAKRFLAHHPRSPHVERLERLIGAPAKSGKP